MAAAVHPVARVSSPYAGPVAPPPAMHLRPRTVLPPLASLSLPGSPIAEQPSSHSFFGGVCAHRPDSPPLHHPRPTYPRTTPPPLLVASSPAPAPAPDPAQLPAQASAPAEVYARVYSLLRERLAGCEDSTVRSAADHARGALEARRRSVEEAEHVAGSDRPTKRRRSGGENVVAFYDNPPPALPVATTGEVQQPRRTSAEARLPSPSSVVPASAYLPPSPSASQWSAAAASRRRSFSMPPPPPPASHARRGPPRAATSGPSSPLLSSSSSGSFGSGALPASCSLPALAPHTAAAAGTARRAEALSNVVRSFEAVLAVRAEGRRRSGFLGMRDGASEGHRGSM